VAANKGKSIHVAFSSAGNIVARTTVRADGSFTATARMPSRAVAGTDRARYRATIGTAVTPWLKLSRRLQATGLHTSETDLEVSGTLQKPFPKGAQITVTSQADCGAPPRVIAHVPVASSGHFYRVIAIPETESGFVVRLSAKVISSNGSQAPTFSIARPIQVR
jgi:hypothetical protein